jgi:hypothetical protein
MLGRIPGTDTVAWHRQCEQLYRPIWVASQKTDLSRRLVEWYADVLFDQERLRDAYWRELYRNFESRK